MTVNAHVRYWEDGDINGRSDNGTIPNMPFASGEQWHITIKLKSGKILGWEEEVKTKLPDFEIANAYYKVCDECNWMLLDKDMNPLHDEYSGYVPKILDPTDEYYGFGDYIGLNINKEGIIENWPKVTIDLFINDLIQLLN